MCNAHLILLFVFAHFRQSANKETFLPNYFFQSHQTLTKKSLSTVRLLILQEQYLSHIVHRINVNIEQLVYRVSIA